jgi:hypothetical protein
LYLQVEERPIESLPLLHQYRKDPEGPEIMEAYEDNRYIFYQAGWYLLCTNMDGHHYGTAMEFTESFNGKWA